MYIYVCKERERELNRKFCNVVYYIYIYIYIYLLYIYNISMLHISSISSKHIV